MAEEPVGNKRKFRRNRVRKVAFIGPSSWME
jgi:hypothetical protein